MQNKLQADADAAVRDRVGRPFVNVPCPSICTLFLDELNPVEGDWSLRDGSGSPTSTKRTETGAGEGSVGDL